jgi:Carboxypeptidase regulatory-like domain
MVVFLGYEFLVGTAALTQTATGTILGTIRDSSGSVVPTADVVVTNVDTNISHEFVTDETGSYIVPLLRPGKYRVKASRSGFKSGVQEGIIVGVDQKARVDMTLEVGEVTQIVEVISNASVISTDSASVGQVIENRRVVELPLNGRNFIQLTYLAPGAVRGVGTNSDLFGQGGSVSVNGSRVQGNNFLIDGTDNNNLLFGGFGINPSVEAIQEFKVQNNTYSSEFGRAGGAQINMTTRGGTNDFRGNLFEFLRNDAFDARNFFAVGNPPLKRNQFGGTFGGPLKFPGLYSGKDRTFFFAAYEGLRLRQGVTLTAITPTAALRSGDFSGGAAIIDPETGLQFPNNRIPASRIDPSARQILDQFYPLPNLATAAPNYSSSLSQKDTSNQFTIRLDHKISDKDSVFFRYSLQDTVRFAPSVFNNFGNSSDYRMQNATLSFIHLFDARKINEFRFGYNRPKGGILFNETFGTDLTKPLGIQGGTPDSNFLSFPALSIAGFAGVGASYFSPISDFSNFFDFIDNFTYIKGTHSLKAGFEIKRNHNNNETGIGYNGRIDFTPTFTRGSALADFLLGLPSLSRIAEGNSREYLRDTGNYFYLADDWKLSPRLTLNLGIRYEYNTPWVETQALRSGLT